MAKKSLKSSVKNIFRLTILIGLKEAWLLFANLIGLIYHPFLTIRKIRQNHDLSQTALIFITISLPLLTAVFTTGLIYLAMTIFGINFPSFFKQGVLLLDFITLILTILVSLYLSYWSYQVITKNHYSLFMEKKCH
jgi:hypothetical protein